MATFNLYDTTNVKAGVPYINALGGSAFVMEQDVDLNGISGIVSGDTVNVYPIPAGIKIVGAVATIVTASDAATSATADIKTSAGKTLISTANLKSTAGTEIPSSLLITDIASDGSIQVVPTWTGTVTQKGKITITILGIRG